MKKSRFDNRSLVEVVEFLKSERTFRGDTITLHITYQGTNKPLCVLEFDTTYPELASFPRTEEITDWLPDSPGYTEDEEIGGFRAGYSSWRDAMEYAIGPTVRAIVQVGGRNFKFEEKHA